MPSFEQPSSAEKHEIAVSQEDIDDLYAKFADYEPANDEALTRVLQACLAQEHLGLDLEAIRKGGAEIDGIQRDLEVETDYSGLTGKIYLTVYVDDRFNRTRGETVHFKKNYAFQPSAEALQRKKDEEARRAAEYEAEEKKDRELLRAALPEFQKFVERRLGETLTHEDWKAAPAVFLARLGGANRMDETGTWSVTEVEGNRLRITFWNAKGHIDDVLEFGPEHGLQA